MEVWATVRVISKVVAAAPQAAGFSDVYDLGPALQRTLLLPKEVVYSPAGTGRLFFIRDHLWRVFEVNFSGKSVHVYVLTCHLHHMGSSMKDIFKNLKLIVLFLPHQSPFFYLKRLSSTRLPITTHFPHPWEIKSHFVKLRYQNEQNIMRLSMFSASGGLWPWYRYGRQVWTYL